MEYRKFSQEQLDKAKNADLIAFLSAYMGLEFKRAGKYYQCKQHSSLLHFRFDNDEAGRAAVEKYTAKYQARGYEVHSVFSKGKDVNEDSINAQKQNPRKR